MNKDLVIVESRSVNNESVPITIQVAEVRHGEEIDRREISRGFIFEDFQATIPLVLAKKLIKQNPDEYQIIGSAEKNPPKKVLSIIKKVKQDNVGYQCTLCEEVAKSKAGLASHMRHNHPEEFKSIKSLKSKKKQVTTDKESGTNLEAQGRVEEPIKKTFNKL